MKRFALQIFLFLMLVALVVCIPGVIFERLAMKTTNVSPYARINEVNDMKDVDADLIILGNSRAEMGYDDSLMTGLCGMKCLNLAYSGYSFDYEYHIMYESYLKHNKKPEYIIVDVGPIVFFDHNKPVYNIQMLPYLNRSEFDFYIDLCPQLTKAHKILPIKYFGKMAKVMKEINRLMYPEEKYTKKKRKVQWNKNKDFYGKPQPLENNKTIIELFGRFLDECKSQNIRVILVCSPLHTNDGSKYFDMKGFWNIVMWCNKDTQFTMATYQDYFGNDTLCFSDPGHLNEYGKQLFTTKLIHDLDSVGIINN